MLRVVSALVLLAVVIGTVWFLPSEATLALAVIAAALAFVEYAAIAERLGARVPKLAAGAVVVATTVSAGGMQLVPPVVALMTGVVLIGALAVGAGQPGPPVLRDAAASLFPALYIGLPLGVMAGVHAIAGREAVLLLMLTIIVSDSAQYYCGRAFGRRPLAPGISPKKTVEGAVGGVVIGTAAMTLLGMRVFPEVPLPMLILAGATIVTLGIVGDLFESLLKRSADVKDAGALIPGHGGMLDRIDSWLFAGPMFFIFIVYLF
jgi:phosphatidate cytidylyltransferase